MSIAQGIWLTFGVVCAGILMICGVEVVSLTQSHRLLQGYDAIEVATEDLRGIYRNLREAETTQRGFLLTGDPELARKFELAALEFDRHLQHYRKLVNDDDDGNPNPDQAVADLRTLDEIESFGDRAMARMRSTIERQIEAGAVDADIAPMVREVRGYSVRVEELVAAMVTRNDGLLARFSALQTGSHGRSLIVIGGGGLALLALLAGMSVQLNRRIIRSFAPLLEATRRVGAGDFAYRIRVDRLDEVGRLAASFNDMTVAREYATLQHAAAERARQAAVAALESQGAAIELLSKMANRLQTCMSFEELGSVVGQYLPQVLPDRPGGLYLLREARDAMTLGASWSEATVVAEFDTPDCWAMRRGQVHRVKGGSYDVRCAHVAKLGDRGYRCLPLIAHGDSIGILYLEDPPGDQDDTAGGPTEAVEKRLEILIENLALAIANLRLRESLREQSIRDAVTGLLNRRYLDEALDVEFARARRIGVALSVVMFDVDHFKRINDEYGHDAGDEVLRIIGATLKTMTRATDVVCRYGGEEFCTILPGADIALGAQRAEAVRKAVSRIAVRYQGRTLGPVTISAGVAQWRIDAESNEDVLRRADLALYEAKRAGRDRVVISPSEHEPVAAPPG
ncbi:MAG: diguanylate cyclase [Alphaproteobacteria bacterium]